MKTLDYEANGFRIIWQFTYSKDESKNLGDHEYPDKGNALVLLDIEAFSIFYDVSGYLAWEDYECFVDLADVLLSGNLNLRVVRMPQEQAPSFEFIPKSCENDAFLYRNWILVHNDPDECKGGAAIYFPISGFGSSIKLNLEPEDVQVLRSYFAYILDELPDNDPFLKKLFEEGTIIDSDEDLVKELRSENSVVEGWIP